MKYSDAYKDNGKWADADSTYGGIVELVTALRNGAASTSPAKKYYKYMRPFRWSRLNGEYPQTTIISSLKPQEKADPSNDGGYRADIPTVRIWQLLQWHMQCHSSIRR